MGQSRDIYLKRHSTHKRQTSMASAGFEPEYPAKRTAANPFLRTSGDRDFYYHLEMARSLSLFGQACSMFMYKETHVIGRPVRLYEGCSNLRLGDIFCGPSLIPYWGSNSSFPITIHSLTRFQKSRTRLQLKVQRQPARSCGQYQ